MNIEEKKKWVPRPICLMESNFFGLVGEGIQREANIIRPLEGKEAAELVPEEGRTGIHWKAWG